MKRLLIITIIFLGTWGIFYQLFSESAEKIQPATEPISSENSEPETENTNPNEDILSRQEKAVENAAVEVKPEVAPRVFGPEKPANLVAAPAPNPPLQRRMVSEMKVYLYDFGIDVSSKQVRAGKVIFTVQNNGKFSHNFAIAGRQSFGKVVPGETKVFSANFDRIGEFEILSDRARDLERNMRETFLVIR